MGERERALEIVETIGDVSQFGMKKAQRHTADQLGVISRTIDHLKANARKFSLQLPSLALALWWGGGPNVPSDPDGFRPLWQ